MVVALQIHPCVHNWPQICCGCQSCRDRADQCQRLCLVNLPQDNCCPAHRSSWWNSRAIHCTDFYSVTDFLRLEPVTCPAPPALHFILCCLFKSGGKYWYMYCSGLCFMVLYQYSFFNFIFYRFYFYFILEFKYSFYVIVYMAVTVSFFVFFVFFYNLST